jgi:hypothetical protein
VTVARPSSFLTFAVDLFAVGTVRPRVLTRAELLVLANAGQQSASVERFSASLKLSLLMDLPPQQARYIVHLTHLRLV